MNNRTIYLIVILLLVGIQTITAQNVGIGTTTPLELFHVNGVSLHEGLKVDINGNTQMAILPNDGAGNYHRYWNTLGSVSPVRTIAGPAFEEYIAAMTANNINGNYQIRYGGYGVAGSAISWSPSFSIKYDNGFVGIKTNNPTSELDVNGNIGWGASGALLSNDQGASIELRGTGTPFIDFSNDATIDNDARIVLTGNNQLAITGADVAVTNVLTAKRMKVTATGYPDYVFEDDYDLKTLKEVQAFIEANGHLPGVPAEAEIVAEGLDLNDQSMWQQEKIEELFLHLIEKEEKIEALENKLEQLEQLLEEKLDLKID